MGSWPAWGATFFRFGVKSVSTSPNAQEKVYGEFAPRATAEKDEAGHHSSLSGRR